MAREPRKTRKNIKEPYRVLKNGEQVDSGNNCDRGQIVSELVSGVDNEELDELHLQKAIQAAVSTSGEPDNNAPPSYIPVPGQLSIVETGEVPHPSKAWKDPTEYVKSSNTVEVSAAFALAGGSVYYMDEEDNVWLREHKDDILSPDASEAQVASSSGGNGGVHSPEAILTEDVFELVMAIFEKAARGKVKVLPAPTSQPASQSSAGTGECGTPKLILPPLADLEREFSLVPESFALYCVPDWLPPPNQLLQCAQIVYPHWRRRRLERGGPPIIPLPLISTTHTDDRSPYECFSPRVSQRRRIGFRWARKNALERVDKLKLLAHELGLALESAELTLARERMKRKALSEWRPLLAEPETLRLLGETLAEDEALRKPALKIRISGHALASYRSKHLPLASAVKTEEEPAVLPAPRRRQYTVKHPRLAKARKASKAGAKKLQDRTNSINDGPPARRGRKARRIKQEEPELSFAPIPTPLPKDGGTASVKSEITHAPPIFGKTQPPSAIDPAVPPTPALIGGPPGERAALATLPQLLPSVIQPKALPPTPKLAAPATPDITTTRDTEYDTVKFTFRCPSMIARWIWKD